MLRFTRGLTLVKDQLRAAVTKTNAVRALTHAKSTHQSALASAAQLTCSTRSSFGFLRTTDLLATRASQLSNRRCFSVDAESDPQFRPQTKSNLADSEEMQDMLRQIKEVVTNNDIVLFMKGTPDAPQCGFSGRVVKILSYLNISYESCNVLENPLLREGIKIYSDWPTIPQLYVKGEFIGGADIVTSMFTSGELHELLGVPKPASATGASSSDSNTGNTTTAATASGSTSQ